MPDLIRRFPDMFDVQDNPVMQEAIQ